MKHRSGISLLVIGVVLLVVASPARAVIKLDITVSKICDTSKAVLVGKVASVSPETRVIDVGEVEALRGQSPGERLRIQIVSPPELIKEIVPGQAIVLFIGQAKSGIAAIHLADQWLLGNGVSGPSSKVWRVVQIYDAVRQSFPGRTAALVRVVTDLKDGKRTIVDRWDRKVFPGGVHKRAKLAVSKPSWLLAADVNGDKRPDLLVGSAAGTRLLLATAEGYEDVTAQWGSWGAAGAYRAFGDVNGDGHVDLLLNDTLWINDGRKFTAAPTQLGPLPKVRPLTAALADVTGDQKPDALLLSADGQLRVLENPGSPDKPWRPRAVKTLWTDGSAPAYAAFGDWGDNGKMHVMTVSEAGIVRYALDADGGNAADIQRLTGVDLGKNEKYRHGLKNVLAVALDMDGDRRPDLFTVCDTGGLLLVNRGFGTFLLDVDAAGPVTSHGEHKVPFQLTPATPWAAACLRGDGVDDLLVLAEDGSLYEVTNGPK